ncbi:hypothetical protein L7F22_028630 [Adiantum nelumboides]|nr:hypothetical protein [Adiantum nelumboides]
MASMRSLLRARPWRQSASVSSYGVRSIAPSKHVQHARTEEQQRHFFSSMPAASPASSTNSHYIPGRADAAGTAHYAQRFANQTALGHFRTLRATPQVGDLIVSSLGHGTYLGSDSDSEDREYMEAVTRSLTLGINFIDCASNFRNMRSEVAVGTCLTRAFKQKLIDRNEVIVCTKAGFLSFDFREDIEPRTYIDETYVKTGLFQLNEFVGGCHCLSGPFLKNQLELSRRNFNLDVVDIFFVHNPEIQLNVVPRQTVLSRIKNAFAALEECVSEGKITMYGVASWNAFRTNSSAKLHLSLEELVHFAKEVGMLFFYFKILCMRNQILPCKCISFCSVENALVQHSYEGVYEKNSRSFVFDPRTSSVILDECIL